MSLSLALSLDALVQTTRLRRFICRRMEYTLESAGLTTAQWLVLALLQDRPSATLKEISDAIDYNAGGLSRAVHGLRERALLNARPDPHDRRSVTLSINDAGRTMQAMLASTMAGNIDARLDTMLGRQDLELMLNLMIRATRALSLPVLD